MSLFEAEQLSAFAKESSERIEGKLFYKTIEIDFDVAKKTRILRFLHTHSHAGQISDPEHDPSIHIETQQVPNDLHCLIQKDDDRHFDQMKALVTK